MTWVLLFSAVIFYVIFLAVYLSQSRYKDGQLLGILLPAHAADIEPVRQIRERYRKQLLVISTVMALILGLASPLAAEVDGFSDGLFSAVDEHLYLGRHRFVSPLIP